MPARILTVPNPVLDALLHDISLETPKPGNLLEGRIIDIIGNKILVDIGGKAVGMISGKESHDSTDSIKSLQPGDKVVSYVIEGENEEGYFVLSLRKASQERTWGNFVKAAEAGTMLEVTVNEANKGGLLVLVDGIKGFIPVSQLAPMHYPRVDGANASEILTRLQKLIGEKLHVKIINLDQEGGKLILSEKAAVEEERQHALHSLHVGDEVDGKISGIVKFGIFVAFEGLEGLVHISEIEWGHVKDPSSYGKIGDKVKVKIIGVEGDKISLSMKQLIKDPWAEVAKKFKTGTVTEGTVDRITQFGVFVKLEDDISGLIHLTELSEEPVQDVNKIVKIGETVKVRIISVDVNERRIGLSMKTVNEDSADSETSENDEKKKD